MSVLELSVRLIVTGLLVLGNAFFVAVEFALTRVRQFSEEEFAGDGGLQLAWEMTEELEIYLTACQIGISATSIALGVVAEPAFRALFQPVFVLTGLDDLVAGSTHFLAGALGFLVINVVHMTHGEQTPTYLGVERTKGVVRYGARPLYWFTRAIYPLIALGDAAAKWTLRLFGIEVTRSWLEAEEESIESRADLRKRLGEMLAEGDLDAERRSEIMSALTAGERTIDEIMIEPEEVAALSTETDLEESLATLERQPHTRFPLVGGDLSDYRGIVYVPAVTRRFEEIQHGDTDFEELAAPPMSVPPDLTIADLVDRFQEENQELALVREDGQGEVIGMVTATDAFEAIVGDIRDPTDRGEVAGNRPVD